MSVLIKGMAMPKACHDCPIEYDSIYCNLQDHEHTIDIIKDEKEPDCPLVELTAHGRLIDADAFAENLKNVSIRQGYKSTLIDEHLSVDDVIDAIIDELTGKALCGFELNPTIIEAEGGARDDDLGRHIQAI